MIDTLRSWWQQRQSLRWRLPLSYATIALLAVLALGVTLLGTLRSFYREQERAYLAGNAAAIAEEIAPLLADADLTAVQAQIAGYAFLIQARVQVLDADGAGGETVLADSGAVGSFTPAIAVNPGGSGLLDNLGVVEENVTIVVEEQQETADGNLSQQRVVTRTSLLPAQGSLYGFNLGVDPTAVGARSNLIVEMTIVADNEAVGRLRLSQGPAVGADILRSVAWGWAIAGAVAVLLAALAGWLISRRLTRPLLALTTVTQRMAAGDLDSRARVDRQDEVGALGTAFNTMAGQVQATVTTLRHFVADAAHELNTPLTALRTDLNLLADAATHPLTRERIERAQAQAERLQQLTASLLDLSRLEAGEAGEPAERVDLQKLLPAWSETYASRAEQLGLDFTLSLGDTAAPVHPPRAYLTLALGNVLDNSLKFTPPPGQVTLALQVVGETAVVTVRDTGMGIPAADQAQLFSRFHRGRNTGDIPGSGLGLAIVHTVVTAAGGTVAVASGEDTGGTTVTLTLPLTVAGETPPARS